MSTSGFHGTPIALPLVQPPPGRRPNTHLQRGTQTMEVRNTQPTRALVAMLGHGHVQLTASTNHRALDAGTHGQHLSPKR